jgi:hypothetical protein
MIAAAVFAIITTPYENLGPNMKENAASTARGSQNIAATTLSEPMMSLLAQT